MPMINKKCEICGEIKHMPNTKSICLDCLAVLREMMKQYKEGKLPSQQK